MSHYIVCPIRPAGAANINGSLNIMDKVAKECLRQYWVDPDQAQTYAEEMAKKHPQVAFAVLAPTSVVETLPPPPPKIIRKRINSSGELVLDKGEA